MCVCVCVCVVNKYVRDGKFAKIVVLGITDGNAGVYVFNIAGTRAYVRKAVATTATGNYPSVCAKSPQ